MTAPGYLLDTNVISEVRKPKPHGAVLEWIVAVGPNVIYVPAIAMFELQAGVELTRRQDPAKAAEIESWIDSLSRLEQIIPMDHLCFRACARLMEGRSQVLFADAMIAATARLHGLTVVTRNVRDYRDFDVPLINPFSARR
jgi:predicted nucleic acid-binding protein